MSAVMKLTSLTTAGVQWNNTSAQLPDASTSPSRGYGSTTSQSVSNADESNSSGTGYRKIDYSSTSAPDSDGGYIEIPVVGLNTPFFSIVHGVALGSLATTVLVSFSLLVYLFTYGRRRKVRQQMKEMHAATSQPRRNRPPAGSGPRTEWKTAESPIDGGGDFGGQISGPKTTPARVRNNSKHESSTSFWTWNIGERLVVYLALCDLCYGIIHSIDHAYVVYTKTNAPDRICSPMAFVLLSTVFSQWTVVIFTAVSACSLIVFGKKLNLGRWDWRFLLGTFGLAIACAGVAWGLKVLGPSGVWCYADLRTARGRMFSQVLAILQIGSFGIVAVAYGTIWIKIQRTARLMSSDDGRYRNSARVMMIFVLTFIFQWWSPVIFDAWAFVEAPPSGMLITCVLLANLGGVYNCVAYTVIRRRLQQQKALRGPQVVVKNGTTPAFGASPATDSGVSTTQSAASAE